MQDVVTKSLTKTADSIVTREVRGEEKELIKVPISSTRQDRDGDEMDGAALSGMQSQIREEQPLVFQNHGLAGNWMDAIPYDQSETIGTQADAEIEDAKDGDGDKELNAFVLPDLTHDEGERMLEQAKQGQAIKFSVGFRVKESEPLNPEAENDERQRFVDVDLMETSKVGIPSNPDATATVAAKAAGLTEQMGAAGVEISDPEKFASALAGELVGRADGPDVATLDGVRKDATPDDTRGTCDSDADCPDGEVCVDGECVDEDSVTQSDDFIMDDEADERFAQLEATVTDLADSVESLTETIDESLSTEPGEPDDDGKDAESDGLTDDEREQLETLQAKAEEADAAESETTTAQPDQTDDSDDESDDGAGHTYPEDVIA